MISSQMRFCYLKLTGFSTRLATHCECTPSMGPFVAFLVGKTFASLSAGDSRVQVDCSDLIIFLETASFSSSADDRGCGFDSDSDSTCAEQGYCLKRQRSSAESVD